MIVEFEVRDRVGLIRLNRPDARNAVNSELAKAIEEARKLAYKEAHDLYG